MIEIGIQCGRPLRRLLRVDPALPLTLPTAPARPAPPPVDPMMEVLRRDEQELQAILSALRSGAGQLSSQYEIMRRQMQKAAVDMAVAIAGRLLHERIESGHYAIEKRARELVGQLPSQSTLLVYLNPADLELLKQRLGESCLMPGGTPSLELRADAKLKRGSCRAEADAVQVLADLEHQLEDLRLHLLESLEDAEAQSTPPAGGN